MCDAYDILWALKYHNDWPGLMDYLRAHADVGIKNLMEWACAIGDVSSVKNIYSLGVNVFVEVDKSMRIACENNEIDMVKFLFTSAPNNKVRTARARLHALKWSLNTIHEHTIWSLITTHSSALAMQVLSASDADTISRGRDYGINVRSILPMLIRQRKNSVINTLLADNIIHIDTYVECAMRLRDGRHAIKPNTPCADSITIKYTTIMWLLIIGCVVLGYSWYA